VTQQKASLWWQKTLAKIDTHLETLLGRFGVRGERLLWSSAGVLRNTSLLAVANVLDRVIAFVVVITIGRELGKVEFGRYSIGVAVATIVFQVSALGLNVIVKRQSARDRSLIGRYVGNTLSIQVLTGLMGIFVVVAFGLIAGYGTDTTGAMVGLAVVFALEMLIQLPFAVFESQERMEYELAVISVRILLPLCLPLVFALGYGLQGIIAAWMAINLLRVGLALWLAHTRFHPIRLQADLGFWRALIAESYPLVFATLFGAIYYRMNALMLSFYQGEAEVGIFNAAFSFLNVAGVLSVAFLRSVFPRFAQQACQPQRLQRTFYIALATMAFAGFAIALSMSLLADVIITVVFTSEFANSGAALVILAWAGFFMFMSSTCGVLLNATRRQRVSMYITAGMAAVSVLIGMWLIPALGYIGASYVTLISYVLGFVTMLVVIVRDFRRPEYLIALNRPSVLEA
jgi:O-antigen/teichoic acid export membrane protein